MEYDTDQEKILDEGDEEGGWVDTHHFEPTLEQKICDMSIDSVTADDKEQGAADGQGAASSTPAGDDDDEVPLDMEEFEASGLLDEEDVQTRVQKPACTTADESGGGDAGEIVQTRTYDLHITYDKYYQTPRLWLFGYDEVSMYCFLKNCYN